MSHKRMLILIATLAVLFSSLACGLPATGIGTEMPESSLLCQGNYFLDVSEELLETESTSSYDLCEYETTITNSDRSRSIALYLRVTEYDSDTRETIIRWENVDVLAPGSSYRFTSSVFNFPEEKGDCPDDTHPAYFESVILTGYRGILQTDKCQGPITDQVLEKTYRPLRQEFCK